MGPGVADGRRGAALLLVPPACFVGVFVVASVAASDPWEGDYMLWLLFLGLALLAVPSLLLLVGVWGRALFRAGVVALAAAAVAGPVAAMVSDSEEGGGRVVLTTLLGLAAVAALVVADVVRRLRAR